MSVLLIVCFFNKLFSQADVAGIPGHNRVPGFFVGWAPPLGVAGSLDIRNDWALQNINFLLGTPGVPSGQLDQSGTNNTSFGYQTFNFNAATFTGINNSVFGNGAGLSLTSGFDNTFIGFISGNANTTGKYNTFVGSGAGASDISGSQNTFLGMDAGNFNTTGRDNCFVGFQAGLNNTTSISNTYTGRRAGFGTAGGTGIQNTFNGADAGININDGNNNTYMVIGQALPQPMPVSTLLLVFFRGKAIHLAHKTPLLAVKQGLIQQQVTKMYLWEKLQV